jgi:hypothetical protein
MGLINNKACVRAYELQHDCKTKSEIRKQGIHKALDLR